MIGQRITDGTEQWACIGHCFARIPENTGVNAGAVIVNAGLYGTSTVATLVLCEIWERWGDGVKRHVPVQVAELPIADWSLA